MKLIVEAELDFDAVSNLLSEAKTRLDALTIFSAEEITKLVENLATDEPDMAAAMGSLHMEVPLNEFMVKHVNAKGELSRKKDAKTRERQAYQTTGLSKSARRQIARKAVKSKKANPSGQIRKEKLTKKAKGKRKTMYGLK
ncbi:head scaffolding protein [Acinetobacter phage Acj9]|uniref:Gp68 prohead core protein n=1 Tax=Acinetobacter phage Acj9 TaxID=760939 RepID=E5EPW6_9CAUD|nr:head scaffolding protein [Acinetobacter phage Acj9]ADG60082.1 gp68 prohead core protein [Acinetobacter phage Acj9]